MLPKHLHIVSFDVPYPPNYGGVIDIFYKIKALHAEGAKIQLHCFEYGRGHSKELEKYCEKVYYYKRNLSKKNLLHSLPYIVVSRNSDDLVANLEKDRYPILLEGLHSCFHLGDKRLAGRKKLVRTHNIEHEYYQQLAEVEKDIFRRFYFLTESKKLKRFERVLGQASHLLAISPADTKELATRYEHVSHIPAFHPNETVQIEPGMGEFALYHGNLEIGENNEAALFLINKVFGKTGIPFIIAGNKPSAELIAASNKHENIQLRGNISTEEIHLLIRQAHINILPTFQSTGIKLKLLAALFTGRFCIVNTPMVANTGLEELCIVRDDEKELRATVKDYFHKKFDVKEISRREKILEDKFSNKKNIQKLISLL